MADNCVYTRAKESPTAAALFFNYYIPEDEFNLYLDLKPINDDQLIPPVMIQGEDLHPNFKNYELSKLDPFSPEAALLGKMTSCCQWIGGAGETCAIHGITDPRSGFYVLRDKTTNNIVAQTWAFRTKEGYIVFDSLETHMDFRKNPDNVTMTGDFFFVLANKLTNEHKVPIVTVGRGGATDAIFSKGMLKSTSAGTAVNYTGYSDSQHQVVLSQEKYPFLFTVFYKTAAPDSWNLYFMSTQVHHGSIKKTDKRNLYLYQNAQGIYYQREDSEKNTYLTESTASLLKNEKFVALDTSENLKPFPKRKYRRYQKNEPIYQAVFNEVSKQGAAIQNSTLILPSLTDNPIQLNEQESKEWCDMCYLSDQPWNIKKEYPIRFALSDAEMDERYKLSAKWEKSVSDIEIKWESLKPIAAKVNISVLTDDAGSNLAIMWAANGKAFNVVRDLIAMGSEIPISPQDNVFETIMIWRNWDLAKEIVDVLIQRKVDVKNIRDRYKRTLLHNAVSSPKDYDLDLIKKLVENEVEVDALDNLDQTAFYYACQKNHFEVVNYLISLGANVNARNANEWTILHLVILEKKWDMVKFLIEKKADLTLKNNRDETAIDMLKKITEVPNEIKQLVGLPLTPEISEDKPKVFSPNKAPVKTVKTFNVADDNVPHQDNKAETLLTPQISTSTQRPIYSQSSSDEVDKQVAAFNQSREPLTDNQHSFFKNSPFESTKASLVEIKNSTDKNQDNDCQFWSRLLFCVPAAGLLGFAIYKILECSMPGGENESLLSSSADNSQKY